MADRNVPATYATLVAAHAAAVSGADSVIVQPGTYDEDSGSGYLSVTKHLIWNGVGDVTVTSPNTTFLWHLSASLGAGTTQIDNFTLDCEGTTARGLNIGKDTADAWTITSDGLTVLNPTQYGVVIGSTNDTVTLTDTSVTTSAYSVGGIFADELGENAACSVTLANPTLDLTVASGNPHGIYLGGDVARTNNPSVTVTDPTVTITNNVASSAVNGMYITGIADATVSGGEITVTCGDSAGEAYGVRFEGRNATATSSGCVSSGIVINYNAPAGYALALGQSVSATNTTTGTFKGHYVKGKYYASATPHGILLGQGTTGAAYGNYVSDIFVGILASITTTADIRANVLKDVYGPSIYLKGTTAADAIGNSVFQTGKYDQGERANSLGLLAVTYQGSTDCTAANVEANLVVVRDISKIHALASISGLAATPATPQPCTFINNVYIIPDSVDLDTTDLFVYAGALGAAANQTYAEWIANTEVTGDVIVQLPISKINQIIASSSTSRGIIGSMIG